MAGTEHPFSSLNPGPLLASEVCVTLLVWCPVDPTSPLDVGRAWPRGLQVTNGVDADTPGVVMQPGESVRAALARLAGALGLHAPAEPLNLLAVDQRPPTREVPRDQFVLVFDGGWMPTEALPVCGSCEESHLRWEPYETLPPTMAEALRVRMGAVDPPGVLWRGERPRE